MGTKISENVKQDIIQKYYTHTASELSRIYGIKVSTIKGIWQRNGLKGKTTFSPDPIEFSELYQNNSVTEVANYYNKDRHTITKYAKKLRLYSRPEKKISKQQEQDIVERYYTHSSTELAAEYQVSTSRIQQIWHNHGLSGKQNRIYHLNENYFQNIDSDEKAYWVGFIAADGCIYQYKEENKQDILSIALAIKDIEHLRKFQQALQTNKPISIGKHGKNKQYQHASLQVSSNKISVDLQRVGITPRKTYNVKWPTIPENLLPAYIRGYFDGDGTISTDIAPTTLHKTYINLAGYETNMKNFQEYLSTKGIQSTIYCTNKSTEHENFCSLLFTNKKNKQKFLSLIYNNASVYLERKYELAQKFIDLCTQYPNSWEVKKDI